MSKSSDAPIDLGQIRELIDLLIEKEVSEFAIEQAGEARSFVAGTLRLPLDGAECAPEAGATTLGVRPENLHLALAGGNHAGHEMRDRRLPTAAGAHQRDPLTRGYGELVDFQPRTAGEVSLYACGPTVYDVPHIGHAYTTVTPFQGEFSGGLVIKLGAN